MWSAIEKIVLIIVIFMGFTMIRKDVKDGSKDDDDKDEQQEDAAIDGLPPEPVEDSLPADESFYKNIASKCYSALSETDPDTMHTVLEKVAMALEPITTKDEMNAVIHYFGVKHYNEPIWSMYTDWSGGLVESIQHQASRAGASDEFFGNDIDSYFEKRLIALEKINDKLSLANFSISLPDEL